MKFEGKAVLVTGGATGIGKATAIAFAVEMQTAGRAIEFARRDFRIGGTAQMCAVGPTTCVIRSLFHCASTRT